MEQIAATLSFYAIALSYPIITGPLAAYVLVLALKRDDRRLVTAFWAVLLLLHLAGFSFIVGDPRAALAPGLVACLITPVFAVSTALGLRIASRRLSDRQWETSTRRNSLRIGTFLIPLMQVSTVLIAMLMAPPL